MVSLKAFSETLAPFLASTPAALYERQRALIRLGMLPPPVQGRGHGLPATPETVATLIVAVMATDNLSDTDQRVRRMAKARYSSRQDDAAQHKAGVRCKLTGKVCFVDALAAILGSERLAAEVIVINASRETYPAGSAVIDFRPGGAAPERRSERSVFGRVDFYHDHMLVETTLYGKVVQRIEAELRKALQRGS
jgi:hypothetical protein